MKKFLNLLVLLLVVGIGQINGKTNTESPKVYYFHSTHRCVTCQAVEKVTRESLNELYGDKISFQSVNNDENANEALMRKFRIKGQTLLIVKGTKMVNLTNEAFMNARSNPDKLKAKIKTTIDSMLK